MALAIKSAAVYSVIRVIADRRPRVRRAADAAEIDVVRQTGVERGVILRGVDLVGKPLELRAVCDLIIAVFRESGLARVGDGNGALRGEAAVRRGDGNGRRTGAHAGNNTLRADGGNVRVTALPANTGVVRVLRLHGRGKRRLFAADERKLALIQRHARDGNRAAGGGVIAIHKAEAVEVVVFALLFGSEVPAVLNKIRDRELQRLAAGGVVQQCKARTVVAGNSACGIKQSAIAQGRIFKVRRVIDVYIVRAFRNGHRVELLIARNLEMVYINRTLFDVVDILRALCVERDGGKIEALIMLRRVEGLRAAANGDLRRRGSKARVGRAAIRVHRHQVIRTSVFKRIGVAAAAVLLGRNNVQKRHILVVNADIHAGHGGEHIAAAVGDGFGVILERGKTDRAARRNAVGILIEARERAAVRPEAPVAVHGDVDRVAVREEDVVRRRTPARAHQRIDMVAVVHEILVVTPEILHVHGRGAAGETESSARIVIRLIAAYPRDTGAAGVVDDLRAAARDLRRIQSEIVYANHVKIQMQRRRTLDDLLIHILARAVFRVVTVIRAKILAGQIEVRDGHLKMRDGRAVLAPNRHAVARDRHIHRDRIGGRLIVAVLVLVALRGLRDGDRELHAGRLAVGARRRDSRSIRAHGGVRERETLLPIDLGDLGMLAVIAAVQRIGQRMAFAVGEILRKLDRKVLSLLCCKGFARIRRREASVRRERRYRQQREHHQQREKQCKTFLTRLHWFFPFLSNDSLNLPFYIKRRISEASSAVILPSPFRSAFSQASAFFVSKRCCPQLME